MELELFSSTTVIIITTTAFIIIYLTSYTKKSKNLPPGPRGLPIFGHLIRFRPNEKVHEDLEAWAKDYGNVMRVKLGSYDAVVLTGYDVIKEAMIDKAEWFSERPLWLDTISGLKRETGTAFNSDWLARRRFVLVSMRGFGLGKKSLEERMQEEAGYLTEALTETNEKPIDMFTLLPFTTANIICSIVIGSRFPHGDKEMRSLLDTFTLITRGSGNFCFRNFIPLGRYLPSADFRATQRGIEGLHGISKKWYHEHEQTFDPDNIRDLIDLFIEEGRKNSSAFGEMDLVNTISELFAAGTETTSTTLCWALLYLIHDTKLQDRCRQDIHKIIGPERPPVYDDIKKLPYINAIINEVQRIANIVPLTLWHSTADDVTLAGYTIPKDTIIIPNVQTAMRDPKYWKDPDTFNPDRWIGDDGKIIKNPAFIPFFTGKRICLGEQLAKKELFIFLTVMLQRFRFTMEDESNPPSLGRTQGVLQGPVPFKVRAVSV